MGNPTPPGTNDTGLSARVIAMSLEISHLSAMATHPATRTELANVQQLLDAAVARMADPTAPATHETIEKVLEVARRRLQAVHDALADGGQGGAI